MAIRFLVLSPDGFAIIIRVPKEIQGVRSDNTQLYLRAIYDRAELGSYFDPYWNFRHLKFHYLRGDGEIIEYNLCE